MRKATILIMGLANIGEALQIAFRYEKKIYKVNLFICLLIYTYTGYKLFIETSLLNYYAHPAVKILTFFYFSVSLLFIEMIFVEFNLKNKINFSTSAFFKKTNLILILTKKKYITSNKNEIFEKKTENKLSLNNKKIEHLEKQFISKLKNIDNKFNKNEIFEKKIENKLSLNNEKFEHLEKRFTSKLKNIDNKLSLNNEKIIYVEKELFFNNEKFISLEKSVEKLKNKVFEPKIIKHKNIKGIKNLFTEFKEDLFENLEIKNFIGYLFINPYKNRIQKKQLLPQEKDNIISILILLINAKKIERNILLAHTLLNEYLELSITCKTLNNYYNDNHCSLTNYKRLEVLKNRISEI